MAAGVGEIREERMTNIEAKPKAVETLSVRFRPGVRPDGELEYVRITQGGQEIRLTAKQAESLRRTLAERLGK